MANYVSCNSSYICNLKYEQSTGRSQDIHVYAAVRWPKDYFARTTTEWFHSVCWLQGYAVSVVRWDTPAVGTVCCI